MVTQADYTLPSCRSRTVALSVATGGVCRRRRADTLSAFSSTAVSMHLSGMQDKEVIEEEQIMSGHNCISLADFSFNVNAFEDKGCIFLSVQKGNVLQTAAAVAWPTGKRRTARNLYAVKTILATSVALRRVSSPFRWTHLQELFGNRSPTFQRNTGRLSSTCGRLLIIILTLFLGASYNPERPCMPMPFTRKSWPCKMLSDSLDATRNRQITKSPLYEKFSKNPNFATSPLRHFPGLFLVPYPCVCLAAG